MSVVLAHQDPGQEEEGDAPMQWAESNHRRRKKKSLCKMPTKWKEKNKTSNIILNKLNYWH